MSLDQETVEEFQLLGAQGTRGLFNKFSSLMIEWIFFLGNSYRARQQELSELQIRLTCTPLQAHLHVNNVA